MPKFITHKINSYYACKLESDFLRAVFPNTELHRLKRLRQHERVALMQLMRQARRQYDQYQLDQPDWKQGAVSLVEGAAAVSAGTFIMYQFGLGSVESFLSSMTVAALLISPSTEIRHTRGGYHLARRAIRQTVKAQPLLPSPSA